MIWTYIRKCSLLTHSKVHKYNLRIQLIFFKPLTSLLWDLTNFKSLTQPHQSMDHIIVHKEMTIEGTIHEFWVQKSMIFMIFLKLVKWFVHHVNIQIKIYKTTWALQWWSQGIIGLHDTQIGPPICACTHRCN
jgi:hypothetical protein